MEPIFATQEATRVETCSTIHGVASPRVSTASDAHEIAEPTSCESTSRTMSCTTCTIVDATLSPVAIAPAQVAAPCRCCAESCWNRR